MKILRQEVRGAAGELCSPGAVIGDAVAENTTGRREEEDMLRSARKRERTVCISEVEKKEEKNRGRQKKRTGVDR